MSKSYIKWVGGKSQLAAELTKKFPKNISRYKEPFCGSASIFYHLYDRPVDIFDNTILPKAYLNDSNPFLVNLHVVVKEKLEELKEALSRFQYEYISSDSKLEFYLKKRIYFNSLGISAIQEQPVCMAALFIVLNKLCFNGIWRVNKKNEFNVPFNNAENVNLCNNVSMRVCSEILNRYAEITCKDFSDLAEDIKEGDFFFIDPPYVPVSKTSNFTAYTKDGWSAKDDVRLQKMLKKIDSANAKFMMTNSPSEKVVDIFSGWNVDYIEAHRFVKALSKDETERDKVNETILTNYG